MNFLRDVARTLLQVAVMAAVFCALFIILSFLVHGHVKLY